MEDRTNEFLALAREVPATGDMKSIHGGTASAVPTSHPTTSAPHTPSPAAANPALAELRSFRLSAAEISKDVSTTSSLLAELARLVTIGAGGTRMFTDDSADERADALVLRIKSNIEGLHSRLEDASIVLERSKRRLGKNSQAGMEASNMVGHLRDEFVKTTSGFKEVLEKRSDGMKDAKDRKRRVFGVERDEDGTAEERVDLMTLMNKPSVYGADEHKKFSSFAESGMASGGAASRMPALDLTSGMMAMAQRHQDMTGGLPAGESTSQLPRPHGITSYDNGLRLRHANSAPFEAASPVPSFSGSTSSYYPDPHSHHNTAPLTPMDIQRMETESGVRQYQLIPDQDYLRQRADAMSQVESNIVELGTIFNKLAVMVNEHKEMVQRVEDNVEDANTSVNLSLAVLTDTLRDLQTNRALGMKVLGIMVLFIIMFIIFFA